MKVMYSYRNKGFYCMRKSIVLLMVLFILFSFCSCLTIDSFSGGSSNSVIGNSYVENDNQDRNVYSSYSYSTKFVKDEITKEDEIFILSNSTEYSWNRTLEEEMKRQFEEQGISVYISSDYIDIDKMEPEDVVEYIRNQYFLSENDSYVRFFLQISVNTVSSYFLGNGIEDVGISVSILDMFSGLSVERIDVDIIGKENNYEDYNSSMETVVKLISKEIVEEYTKYLTPTT